MGQFLLLLLRWLLWRREQIVQVPAKSCEIKRENLCPTAALDAIEGALQTWYWHMNLHSGHVSKSVSDHSPSPGGTDLGCVVHWPLSYRAAHGPFCTVKQAWPSRTRQLLISVRPQEQNQSRFGAFLKLWFFVYVVCPDPNSWGWCACNPGHEQLSSYNGQKARAGEPAFLLPAPWCWKSTGGNECH